MQTCYCTIVMSCNSDVLCRLASLEYAGRPELFRMCSASRSIIGSTDTVSTYTSCWLSIASYCHDHGNLFVRLIASDFQVGHGEGINILDGWVNVEGRKRARLI